MTINSSLYALMANFSKPNQLVLEDRSKVLLELLMRVVMRII